MCRIYKRASGVSEMGASVLITSFDCTVKVWGIASSVCIQISTVMMIMWFRSYSLEMERFPTCYRCNDVAVDLSSEEKVLLLAIDELRLVSGLATSSY